MSFEPSATNSSTQYIAYVCTDKGAAVARAVVEQTGGDSSSLHGGGLSGAARLGAAPSAVTVLAEIGNIPVEMASECVSELCSDGARVIVLGEQTDINTYRALQRAGATEYFGFPVTADEILATQDIAPVTSNIVQMPVAPKKAPSVAVIGSNGGVGASLLAQNLAFHISAAKGENLRTALLDADLQFGSQAIDLDREETVGMFEALMGPERIDETFINATMDQLTDRLSLYSKQIGIGQEAGPYEGGLRGLIARLREEFEGLVTDIPRTTLIQRPELAENFDAIVMVIPAGFSGVNAASRLIKRLHSHNADLHIVPVLSDLRHDARLSMKDVQTTIGQPVIATLPRCDTQMARAHRAARPMIQQQPRGPYAKAVGTIWTAAMAGPVSKEKAQARPILKRLFG